MTQEFPADAPLCPPADRNTRTPRIKMPLGACDTHAHVCGPLDQYPCIPNRLYTPPPETFPMYRAMLDTLGVERAVLTQPSVYGTDNRCLLDALAQGGESVRGVAVVDASITDTELRAMDDAGIRGIRINIVDRRDNRNVLNMDELMPIARRIAELDWHIEFLLHSDAVPDLAGSIAKLPVPVVLGHLGYVHAERGGANNPGFHALLKLIEAGQTWVKLTAPYRISAEDMPFRDTNAMAHALVRTAPERLIWGTDWPHVKIDKAMPNDGEIADILLDWVPDVAIRHMILVENPIALYGFDDELNDRP
jgi:predicted TIM-barrel fold metal-dependent hydrolase